MDVAVIGNLERLLAVDDLCPRALQQGMGRLMDLVGIGLRATRDIGSRGTCRSACAQNMYYIL